MNIQDLRWSRKVNGEREKGREKERFIIEIGLRPRKDSGVI